MSLAAEISSPTRRYVAVCPYVNRPEYGPNYYELRPFTLPEDSVLQNNCAEALWYYMNVLDAIRMVDVVITRESYDQMS